MVWTIVHIQGCMPASHELWRFPNLLDEYCSRYKGVENHVLIVSKDISVIDRHYALLQPHQPHNRINVTYCKCISATALLHNCMSSLSQRTFPNFKHYLPIPNNLFATCKASFPTVKSYSLEETIEHIERYLQGTSLFSKR